MAESGPDRSKSSTDFGAPPTGGAPSSLLGRVLGSLNALGSIWIFVLMVLINIDAGGRTWFSSPIDGVVETIELSLVGIVFLQLGDATRHGRLTRSDGFFRLLLAHKPAMGRFLGALFDGMGILFMGIILWGSVPIFLEAYREDHYVGDVGIFTAPEWPVKLVIVIGCVVTALQFAAFGRRYLTDAAAQAEPETDRQTGLD